MTKSIMMLLAAGMALVLLSACRGDGASKTESGGTPPAAASSTVVGGRPAGTAVSTATVSGQPVTLELDGGVRLAGRLYGRGGPNGLIFFADEGRAQDVWDAQARELAGAGYVALTIDLPGQGVSVAGKAVPPDSVVRAAAALLRTRGVEKIVLVGEGAGGALAVSAATGQRVNGVVLLSAPATYRGVLGEADAGVALAKLDVPVLIMGAVGDAAQAADAHHLYDGAREPRTLALTPGTARGADLLRGDSAAGARDVLRDFLRSTFAPGSA